LRLNLSFLNLCDLRLFATSLSLSLFKRRNFYVNFVEPRSLVINRVLQYNEDMLWPWWWSSLTSYAEFGERSVFGVCIKRRKEAVCFIQWIKMQNNSRTVRHLPPCSHLSY
jgi:hypothetical protein